jgi:nucleoside-diphosphate-sugar epimerase
MKVAITGGAGFIGHNLAIALKDHHEVLVVDALGVNNLFAANLPRKHHAILRDRMRVLREAGLEITAIDARQFIPLANKLVDFDPDVIVHLAAVAHMDRSQESPREAFDANVLTLQNAMEVARLVGARQFIFFSSSTVYGDFVKNPIAEDDRRSPTTIYGWHKFIGEALVKGYGDAYAIPWTIFRPQALYGPRCISNRVIQKFVEAHVDGEPIVVNGDGSESLDFTYIDDVTDAVQLSLGNTSAMNEAFNLSAGRGRTLRDVLKMLGRDMPTGGPMEIDTIRRPKRGTMDISKAKRLLGYVPKWQLESGIPAYVRWYKEFKTAQAVARGTKSLSGVGAP